ncbi:MAG: L-carnitine dehydratase/bile acid-inducible protein [Rhodoferax sp.]|nr:L-carnitine dehydratase/bile acid-inducible protein [Rhodoferax sp.]
MTANTATHSAAPTPTPTPDSTRLMPLKGLRILSLALNLPGPAAVRRCRQMGAVCVKLEPPAKADVPAGTTGDPMSRYSPAAYAALQQGVKVRTADLKSTAGQALLHRELARADVLVTSFRPSALHKLGLGWKALHQRYPALSQVAIVGGPGAAAESPGHDLTYLAENGLVPGLDLPATLYADMAGALQATEAVLQAALLRGGTGRGAGRGVYLEIALSDAAATLALPRGWGLTASGAVVGGGHAGYAVYSCKNGRVAVAALEPHFAQALCIAAGVAWNGEATMTQADTHAAVARFLATQTCAALDRLARSRDIPLTTMGKSTAHVLIQSPVRNR